MNPNKTITPFFSIILPTYNRAYVLTDSINSVLSQTYVDFELIIIDDGSTDSTAEVVKSISDPRIRYIYQNNQERSAARNNGIELALGTYVCFIDSDDFYESNHLQVLHNYISSHDQPVELIFTNCFIIDDGKKEKAVIKKMEGNTIAYFLRYSVIPDRVCIHKDILEKIKFRPDVVISEDTVLFVSIANRYPIKQIEEYTVSYRIHDDNSIHIKNNCYKDRLDGLHKLFEDKEIKKKAGKKLIAEVISICYIGIARHYEYKRSFSKMIGNIFMSFIHKPDSVYNKSTLFMIYKYIFRK